MKLKIFDKSRKYPYVFTQDLRAWMEDLRERAREASKVSIYGKHDPLAVAYEKVFKELLAELESKK